jgi:hypothetical protein
MSFKDIQQTSAIFHMLFYNLSFKSSFHCNNLSKALRRQFVVSSEVNGFEKGIIQYRGGYSFGETHTEL